jgi:hypothetical protein
MKRGPNWIRNTRLRQALRRRKPLARLIESKGKEQRTACHEEVKIMCPFCLTTLGIIVADAASTGGLAAAILSGKKAGAREAFRPGMRKIQIRRSKDSPGRADTRGRTEAR